MRVGLRSQTAEDAEAIGLAALYCWPGSYAQNKWHADRLLVVFCRLLGIYWQGGGDVSARGGFPEKQQPCGAYVIGLIPAG